MFDHLILNMEDKETLNPAKERKLENNHNSINYMYMLFTNQGLIDVTEQILSYLNPTDLENCLKVAQTWRNFIDSSKSCWKLQLKIIRKQTNFSEFPEWKSICDRFLGNENTEQLIKFTKFTWRYFEQDLLFEILEHGSPLHFAVAKNLLEIFELLTTTPLDFNMIAPKGYAPIHYVNSFEMLRLFIRYKEEKNIDLYVFSSDDDGRNFLHELVKCGKSKLVGIILEKRHEYDFKIDSRDIFNRNIIHLACLHGKLKVLKKIFELANEYTELFNAGDSFGQTPLNHACKHGYFEVVKLFLLEAFFSKIDTGPRFFIGMGAKGTKHVKVSRLLQSLTPTNLNILDKIYDRDELRKMTSEDLIKAINKISIEEKIENGISDNRL